VSQSGGDTAGNSDLSIGTLEMNKRHQNKTTIPTLLPSLEVFWELSPANAPTQHKDDARYAAWWISGKLSSAAQA
jgi:hypothetical protein